MPCIVGEDRRSSGRGDKMYASTLCETSGGTSAGASFGEMEPVLRLPILRSHARETCPREGGGIPVLHSIASFTESPAFAVNDTAVRFDLSKIRSRVGKRDTQRRHIA